MASFKTTHALVALVLALAVAADAKYSYCKGNVNYAEPPRGVPPAPVKLRDDQFVKVSDGSTVRLKAFNWFGFNNGQTALDGLWAGGNAAQMDMATITYQLRLLGFNGVRLPFIFGDLKKPPTKGFKFQCDPVSDAYLKDRTTDPNDKGKTGNKQPFKPYAPRYALGNGKACNGYLPDSSTLDRYLWTIQWFVANNFYVLIDYHSMGLEWTVNNADEFVKEWKAVWSAVACLPNFDSDLKGRVFIDIMNEPDSMGIKWEAGANNRGNSAGVKVLYLKTMDALWSLTPNAAIFFIEGAGQGGIANTNWGNGFATDMKAVQQYGLSDPNPFFKELMKKPYRKSVVISPHVYGPSVTNSQHNTKGVELFKVLDTTFGYLTKKGYCIGSDCQRFPVAIGEFGSKFTDPRDLANMNDFADYLNAQGAGNTGGHNAIGSWFYWSWNANSGDTGGLIDDSWRNLMWVKLRYLSSKLGLKPWYKL